jgi:HD-GYP domain-containing protein (c-di-GMP phosphodiesterase class II)
VGTEVRLAELMAALSVAVDLGLGETVEHAQRSAIVAVALARAAGLDEAEASDAYYLALLRTVGCTGDHDFAFRVLGEDLGSWAGLAAMGPPTEMLRGMLREVGRGEKGLARVRRVAQAMAGLPQVMRDTRIHCEVGTMLSQRLGLPASVVAGLGQVFERWDGKGQPLHLRAEAISRAVRVAQLASDIELGVRQLGLEAARTLLGKRAGKGHDPRLVQLFLAQAPALLGGLDQGSLWQAVLDAEPGPRPRLQGEALDRALRAMGEFADMKSVFTRGHSAAVADLCAAACQRLGLPAAEVRAASHAAHLHDLGRVSVFAYVWDKPGPLSDAEWEKVRMHSYYTERILARLTGLGDAVTVASLAHERRDGSGYHRRISGRMNAQGLPAAGRVLAAADVYQALISPRPHRPAFSPGDAACELRAQGQAGKLDAEVVEAVLASAGHPARKRGTLPAGLSSREVEVLALMARGLTNKEIAAALGITPKTAGHHAEHIFEKVGVTTRAAAALFAMQNDLLIAG